MIVQEPVQAAIWHCLNHYDYADAVFLSERLYAEVKTDESLFLLATAYFRSGKKDHAYHTLKDRIGTSSQCRYLFGICAYELEKYGEAEAALLENNQSGNNLDEVTEEFGDQASFALLLLGKIAAKTERKARAIDAWKKALKLNPFLWSSFEELCNIGDKPNPQSIFQINSLENLSMCHGSRINNIESVIITNKTPNQDSQEVYIATPQQILTNCNPNLNVNTKQACTPEESPWRFRCACRGEAHPGFPVQGDENAAGVRYQQPSAIIRPVVRQRERVHGHPNMLSQPTLTESNSHHQSLTKRMRAHVDQLINRKESIFQNCKPVFSQSTNVPASKTPTIPLAVQPGQNVRRSSRLFSNSYSVKENNKSPNRTKFATPKSPSRKTKQRMSKCNLNKNSGYVDLNTRNKIEKEKTETVTSEVKTEKSAIPPNAADNCIQQAIYMQKQSAEGLMCLLRDLGQAYLDLAQFDCDSCIEHLNSLPPNQFNTSWIYCLLGLAAFEQADYEASVRYFGEVHDKEPYRLEYMDVYSTALWHLQREVALSALAQDLIGLNKNSPVTWCVSGNCFSLHKEHDTAIKFFQRAVQVDPGFPYAYTLLGHEYITDGGVGQGDELLPKCRTIYSKQERYHLAEMNYSKALSINPKSSVILCHIGVVQHALKETEKALATFNTAISNNPKSPLCKFHRGSIYFALGRHAEALKELEELKEIVPKESLVYYLIAGRRTSTPRAPAARSRRPSTPSIGRNATEIDSPISPATDEHQSEGNWDLRPVPLNFSGLPDDSEDSF
ncbi:hypothetical protein NQ318_020601 [Aromia moschata]|uniref:Cell division cycle protein 27 homolog n=1 Tax=Aromia moschata TaxID=1265417 RepID=A0AAV8Z1S6_9CUCU|nr:hypothetical protein NQ318_020601 [Aromia moschata]